jgi:dihydroorotate dehydrogenase
MMDLTTCYLGLTLKHPLIAGASPMVDHMDLVRRLEDAGVAAITMHSLFEEQLSVERAHTWRQLDQHANAHAEAATYLPKQTEFALGPDQYLERLRRIKDTVSVPVIASHCFGSRSEKVAAASGPVRACVAAPSRYWARSDLSCYLVFNMLVAFARSHFDFCFVKSHRKECRSPRNS